MARYYDPVTRSESVISTNSTSIDDMPEASKEWFTREAEEGKVWVNDSTNTYPIEIDIPPPTQDELKKIERVWSNSELKLTDRILISDSSYSESDKIKVIAYRDKLRNPQRESTSGYPDRSWRPVWPEGVKYPD